MSAPNLFDVAVQCASSRSRPSTAKRGRRIAFNVTEGEDVRTITPAGRDAWALGELITAGNAGCTPIDRPGPRWSGYIHKLRRVYGLNGDDRRAAWRRVFRSACKVRAAFQGAIRRSRRRPASRGQLMSSKYDRWNENRAAVVAHSYGDLACYPNDRGDVVLKQMDDMSDDDQTIIVPIDSAERMAAAILDAAKIGREIIANIQAEQPPEQEREPRLALPAPNDRMPTVPQNKNGGTGTKAGAANG
jgi:hypothetical protein